LRSNIYEWLNIVFHWKFVELRFNWEEDCMKVILGLMNWGFRVWEGWMNSGMGSVREWIVILKDGIVSYRVINWLNSELLWKGWGSQVQRKMLGFLEQQEPLGGTLVTARRHTSEAWCSDSWKMLFFILFVEQEPPSASFMPPGAIDFSGLRSFRKTAFADSLTVWFKWNFYR